MSLNSVVQVTSTGIVKKPFPRLLHWVIRRFVFKFTFIAEAGQQISMQAKNVERPVPVAVWRKTNCDRLTVSVRKSMTKSSK